MFHPVKLYDMVFYASLTFKVLFQNSVSATEMCLLLLSPDSVLSFVCYVWICPCVVCNARRRFSTTCR